MDKGLIQVYTGDGKGKTTAAVGQGIRAVGSGNRVYMVQFLKSSNTGELETIKRLEPDFKVFRFEKKRDFIWNLNQDEINELKEEVRTAFEFVKKAVAEGQCDVIILDEIMAVLRNNLLNVGEVVDFLRNKPLNIEIILTGRNVPKDIIDVADYVSDIGCVKHPFEKGISARKGIEF